MFVACHPVLSREGRVALTLKLLGGLTTAEIARAYLVAESTIAQRIVRAKRTLSEANVPFEVPQGSERRRRLASILEAMYLIFNEGYSATAGDDVLRPELVEDALRLGRMLSHLMPDEPEVHGLVALMELRLRACRRASVPTERRSCSSIKIAVSGTLFSYDEVLRHWTEPNRSAPWGPTVCKPASPRVTHARRPPIARIGLVSPRFTTR